MAEQKLNVRLNLKYDSFENWQKSTLVLNAGEAAIAYIDTGDTQLVNGVSAPQTLIKIGDGKHTFKELPFLSALGADIHSWAKAPNKPTYEAAEITGISTYISEYVSNEMGIEIDTDHEYKILKVTDYQYKLMGKAKGDADYTLECGIIDIPQYDDAQVKADIDALEALVGSDTVAKQIGDAITALDLANTYAAKEHAHTMAEVDGLEDAIAAINDEEAGILAQAKSYTDDELIFENGITTVNALGGIAAGQSLDGKSAIEILDMLLFPYVKQTISNVKGSPNGGTFECGNNQIITSVSATVTKKSKPITKVELLQGSTVLATKEGDEVKNGGTFTFSGLSVAVNSTNVQLTVKAYDENGSTVTGTTGAFTFVYPYYYGVCAAGATVDEALVEGLTKDVTAKGQKAYSYTTDNQCAVIAYPKAHGVLKSALDPNAFENIASFTRSEVSVTGLDGKAQTYYVYVSGAFTGSGFKYTFKY